MGEGGADPNFTTLQTLTLALSADPKYMAGIWSAWCAEMEADGWTEKQVSEAKRWLSMVALNELVSPEGAGSHESRNRNLR